MIDTIEMNPVEIARRAQVKLVKIKAEKEELMKKIRDLEEEEGRIELAFVELRKAAEKNVDKRSYGGLSGLNRIIPRPPRRTVKGVIMEILQTAYPDGLRANDIRIRAARLYGMDLHPPTLAVTLSRLRDGGDLKNESLKWFITKEGISRGEKRLSPLL